ncbi:hypothetical protein UPYG_G00033760 [Umbra pygmaea]|uniref:E-selectin n=1 Tax=Umbra pygmaea TaxID=75934 RepID=A0ABD0XR94_UMBPY
MFHWSNCFRQSLYKRILMILLITIIHDLSSERGVHAWTYHYGTKNQNWDSARQWCMQHYTDMVAIQNQEEIVYLNNMLPKNKQYYWMSLRKVDGVWTWMGTNKTLTREAENWATGEPNNKGKGQDCVEIYIQRGVDEAKWNDELCTKPKRPLCYTASCSEHSCSTHGECVENIGNYTCQCEPGFKGPQCQGAQRCDVLTSPTHGSVNCSGPHGQYFYGSQCQFSCEEGFLLNGTSDTECTSMGTWSRTSPLCLAQRCDVLTSPTHGSVNCSGPHGQYFYGSQCQFSCEEGFLLNGTSDTECTSMGTWSRTSPLCLDQRCDVLTSPTHGSMNCSGPHGQYFYGSQCQFSCEEGFLLNGTSDTECTSMGTWSRTSPLCLAQRCDVLTSPTHGSMNCSGPHGQYFYGSQCQFSCEEGFLLNGTSDTECTSMGTWSRTSPLCLAQRCDVLTSPTHGSMNCSGPHGQYFYGSQCQFSCEEGFLLNGTSDTECTSMGTWSRTSPLCLAQRCDVLTSPTHGSVNCSGPHGQYFYGSQCQFSCEEGFLLNGTSDTECTSMGTWSRTSPLCLARRCPLLLEPYRGWMNCTHPYSHNSYHSQCRLGCNEGFWLTGDPTMHCNTSGVWSQYMPSCQSGTSFGAGLLRYIAVGAASAAGLLVLIGFWLLIKKKLNKTSDFNSNKSL